MGSAEALARRRSAGQQGKPKGSVLDPHEDFILGILNEKPDTTLDEMAERLASERDVRVVRTAVWKFLDRRDQTHKKDCARQRARAPRREGGTPAMGRSAA